MPGASRTAPGKKRPVSVRKGESVKQAAERNQQERGPKQLQDSGSRRVYATGAMRDRGELKPRYSLVPPAVLERIVWIFTLGADKYEDHNFHKGMPYSDYVDSADRHIEAWRAGKTDEDHLAQAIWNLMGIIYHEEYGPEGLDDVRTIWNPAEFGEPPTITKAEEE